MQYHDKKRMYAVNLALRASGMPDCHSACARLLVWFLLLLQHIASRTCSGLYNEHTTIVRHDGRARDNIYNGEILAAQDFKLVRT